MRVAMNEILNPHAARRDPAFPHAPQDWTREHALEVAAAEALDLTPDHWEVIRALQEFHHRHEDDPAIRLRELHDALEERFHARGGRRYLFNLFPGGPVGQGCRLAGLKPPAGSIQAGFGSVA
jgi:TusE/DsrC/DsvC family sulfur relay protein